MKKLKSWSTTYTDYTVVDNSQGYTITKHLAAGIGKKTLNFKYNVSKEEIEEYFYRFEKYV